MRSRLSAFVTASVVLLALSGCDKAKDSAGEAKQEEPAKPATSELKADAEPSKPEPAPEPAKPEPAAPTAGAGFVVGAAQPINNELDGMLEIEAREPLTHAGVTVSVGSHAELDGEDNTTFYLRARVEFEGVDASAGLNHERKLDVSFAERVFIGAYEIAKLPDGRWLVDTNVNTSSGEDSVSVTTERSVILVDPSKRSAAVIWTGFDSGSGEGGGACVSVSEHSFAVDGEVLVVSKTEYTEFDAAMAAELGWSADECKAKPRTTTEVGRVELTK